MGVERCIISSEVHVHPWPFGAHSNEVISFGKEYFLLQGLCLHSYDSFEKTVLLRMGGKLVSMTGEGRHGPKGNTKGPVVFELLAGMGRGALTSLSDSVLNLKHRDQQMLVFSEYKE